MPDADTATNDEATVVGGCPNLGDGRLGVGGNTSGGILSSILGGDGNNATSQATCRPTRMPRRAIDATGGRPSHKHGTAF